MHFGSLRIANMARQAEWPGGEKIDRDFRALELGGEVGELLNLVKKRVRLDGGISGTTEGPAAILEGLRDELGDVIVCLDLCGMEVGVPIAVIDEAKLASRHTTAMQAANLLFHCAGLVTMSITDASPVSPSQSLGVAMFYALKLAELLDIDPWEATTEKFNKTSAKHGFATRL